MSVFRHPQPKNTTQIQVWNNLAFDHNEIQDPFPIESSFTPLKPFAISNSAKSKFDCSKGNQDPLVVKPLNQKKSSTIDDEKNLDSEIEDVKMQITRLKSKLEALRLRKIQLQEKKFQSTTRRRAVSMCPSEILYGHGRMAETTIAVRKHSKKEGVLSIVPQKLFRDGEEKKGWKGGRIVPSRYAQPSSVRKQSLLLSQQKGKSDRNRSLSVGRTTNVKKQWDIPDCIDELSSLLPRVRAVRSEFNTPRDSGAMKRVAELVGKKTYFSLDRDGETSICQALNFSEV